MIAVNITYMSTFIKPNRKGFAIPWHTGYLPSGIASHNEKTLRPRQRPQSFSLFFLYKAFEHHLNAFFQQSKFAVAAEQAHSLFLPLL